jgi:radical SAM superfamily enzyme YgiQ (UPF0313 family)
MRLCLLSINCNERHYSLGVYTLAAMLFRHHPDVTVRVLNHSVRTTPRHILFDVMSEPADVYGLSVHHGHGPLALTIARDIRRLIPNAVIVIGGTDVTAQAPESIDGLIDWCVIGEGETNLLHLLDALRNGTSPTTRAGLLRPRDAGFGVGAQQSQHTNLDDIPSPYLEEIFNEYERYPTIYLETYRGCIWNCNFCYEGRGRSRIASYSDNRIRAELTYLLKVRQVRQIEFYDTIFNVEPQRTLWLLNFLIEYRPTNTSFIGEFMLEWLSDEEIKLIGQANFKMIEVGLQSVKLQTLKRSGRKVNLQHFRDRALTVLERTNVDLCIDAMFGLENESLDDFIATVDYIGEIEGANGRRPTPILFTTNVHPATRLHRKSAEQMILDAGHIGTPLASNSLSLADTERFYEIFHGYLCLRSTFRATMNLLTGAFRVAGVPLSQVYLGVARVLKAQASTRTLFEQVDWSEFRSNRLLRFYLSAIDLHYILAVAETLQTDTPTLRIELERLTAQEEMLA